MEPVHDDGFHQAELENYNQDSVLRSQRVASYVWLLTACVAFVAYVACVACVACGLPPAQYRPWCVVVVVVVVVCGGDAHYLR